MVDFARSGKRVVRLMGGDPTQFGRAGEEIAACQAAGIAVEVVPGIAAARGPVMHAMPLPDRKHA
jgi:uroporphyrin-III C-methyltransferase / precorrin-2 dehydrogenase / sirohydrochlorin ferrochelatase